MTARILVVDDIPANVKLLEARLQAEYFQVVTALNGADALAICEEGDIDLILLDIMMPGMDGFEVCAKLKANPVTAHIPVVIVTALDQPADRIRGLEAGADDFLTKPANDLQLMSRVKSLVRLKTLTDELRLRAETTRSIGIDELLSERAVVSDARARILAHRRADSSIERIQRRLRNECDLEVATDPQLGFFQAVEKEFRLRASGDRLCQFRSAAHLFAAALAGPYAVSADSLWLPSKARIFAFRARWNLASMTMLFALWTRRNWSRAFAHRSGASASMMH